MATDWDQLSTDLYDLLGMGSGSSKGQLWEAWKHAKKTDHDEFHDDAWNWFNDDEMWAYYNEQVAGVESAYPRIMSAWSSIYNDRKYISSTGRDAETWDDDVVAKIRNESYVLQAHSRVKESWYGASADKYNGAMQTQVAAIDEFHAISTTIARELANTNNVLKGIMMAIKESFTPVKDKLNSASDNVGFGAGSFGGEYFEFVTYGRVQLESLADWIEDVVERGDWKNTMDLVNRNLEDARVRTVAFLKGWPESTTGNMHDMDNGKQQQPGGPGQQPPPSQPSQPSQPINPNAEPTTGPQTHQEQEYNEGKTGWGNDGETVTPGQEG